MAARAEELGAYLFSDFETIDRHWEARLEERLLGFYESLDEDEEELARVAILGRCGDLWFVATCLVDGQGEVQDLLGTRSFGAYAEADRAYRGLR